MMLPDGRKLAYLLEGFFKLGKHGMDLSNAHNLKQFRKLL